MSWDVRGAIMRDDFAGAARLCIEQGTKDVGFDFLRDECRRVCAAGKCTEMAHEFFAKVEALPWKEPPPRVDDTVLISAFMCPHADATHWRLRNVLHPPTPTFDSAVQWLGTVYEFLMQIPGPTDHETDEFLWLLVMHGARLRDKSFFPPLSAALPRCRKRFHAYVVNAVAVQLPVEGVPEIVSSYVPSFFQKRYWAPV